MYRRALTVFHQLVEAKGGLVVHTYQLNIFRRIFNNIKYKFFEATLTLIMLYHQIDTKHFLKAVLTSVVSQARSNTKMQFRIPLPWLRRNHPVSTLVLYCLYGQILTMVQTSNKYRVRQLQPSLEKETSSVPPNTIPESEDSMATAMELHAEGGRFANLVVFGSFCTLTGGLGLMNSIGIYQAWIAEHQLHHIDEGQRGWIFGLYNFMVFFCGIKIGPLFDAYGPKWLMLTALTLYVATFASIGFCYEYWHFLVLVGLVAGAATSIVFVVPVATIGQYYEVKRGAATGLAMSGGSLGGIIFPLIFQDLSVKLGFAWTTRIIGVITICLLAVGCVTVRSQVHNGRKSPSQTILPDVRILLDRRVFLLTIGVFFIEWGFFIGLEYISSYAITNGIKRKLSYLMIVFLNAGSFPGRWLPGILGDKFGRLNILIGATILCAVSMLAIWLPADGKVSATITFAVIFGFASGSNISLVPVCVGEFCPTENYGTYYTTVYTVVSFGYVASDHILTSKEAHN